MEKEKLNGNDAQNTANTNVSLREKAEQTLAEDKILRDLELQAMSPHDIQKMVHELRVYQIELEMQNDQLKRTEIELDRLRSRYFELYDLAPMGYWTLSEKGVVKEANLTLATLLGVGRNILVQSTATSFIYPDDQDQYYLSRRKLFETGEEQNFELRMIKTDKTNFWVRCVATLVNCEDGNHECRMVMVDIGNQKNAEKEIMHAKELAEAANASKSRFLANMSHEIRTPLNGVMGTMQLLNLTELTEEQREYIRISQKSSESLMAVIKDILDYSKIEVGKMEIENIDFSIRKVMEESMALFKVSADEKGLDLDMEVDETIPEYLKGDPFRLRQVLSNLVGNAVKYTKFGSVKLRVTQKAVLESHKIKLEFEVSDTGLGICEDKMDLLFRPFSQVDNSNTRQFGGSGLGLSICKGLVEKMEGEIWVKSRMGSGSRFHFTCVVQTVEPRICYQEMPDALQEEAQNTTKPKILLVEDDEVSSMIIEKFIKGKGWEIEMAQNGQIAIAAFKQKKYDIIFMDVQMPVMDGIKAAAVIRHLELKTNRHTPIIAMTAYALEGDRERIAESGMDDYLSKPIDFQKLTYLCMKHMSPL